MKSWSLSTTVRNPYRLREFLRILKRLEGKIFDENNQIKYQILLIQEKLYKPMYLPEDYSRYYENPNMKMSYKTAKEIFDLMLSRSKELRKTPGLRGRTSAAQLAKMGFCVAKKSLGKVIITEFGNYFLSEDYNLAEVFFRHFIKWQLPNPYSRNFGEKQGFNIKPFIATLHIIDKANKLWKKLGEKPVGISKDEFSLFIPTMINYQEIENTANAIIEYRRILRNKNVNKRKIYRDKYWKKYMSKFLQTKKLTTIETGIHNLKDYGDNIIRYFRLTNYLHIRGNGYYVNLEPRRRFEIDKILRWDNGAADREFKNIWEYIEFISDSNRPVLPWEKKTEIGKLYLSLYEQIQKERRKLKSLYPSVKIKIPKEINIRKVSHTTIKKEIPKLRNSLRRLSAKREYIKMQDLEEAKSLIEELENIYSTEKMKRSVYLEYLVMKGLSFINDALKIKPNYPVGDDNQPTFTAPPNIPDIECYYESFNMIGEVTLLKTRDQWFQEGQSVMRHLRDFENRNKDKPAYCLFIAPLIHRDTLNTFWISVKYEYEGSSLKIIPVWLEGFVSLLKTAYDARKEGKFISYQQIQKVLDALINRDIENSKEWMEHIKFYIHKLRENALGN
ncbi:MAG: AlwI family type II restriction endonuclease [candidate division WOR-3 bacterium]|nr:AlwI family type II restriction endonuclease [candidate division WOR-3 bacterium]